MLKTKLFFSAAILWTSTITFLSIATLGDIGASVPIANKDKYVHFTFYFVFVLLWVSYFKTKNANSNNRWKVLVVAICFGIFMEICQGLFTTTRTPDIFDVLANSAGAVFGLIVITRIYKK